MVTGAVVLVLFAASVAVLFWVMARRRARPREDVWGDWMRRHHLSAGEAGEISAGVTKGRRYSDPRLRAAAADHAAAMRRTEFSDRTVALIVGLFLAQAVLGALRLPVELAWFPLVMWGGFAAVVLRRQRGLRRSSEVNRD